MGLFRRSSPPDPGRRRPVVPDDGAAPPARSMFSYYSQRSTAGDNTGRRDLAALMRGRLESGRTFWARHRILFGILIIISVAAAGYLQFMQTQPRVFLLEDSATSYFLQDTSVYTEAAKQSLNSSLLNHSKLTVNTAALRKDLLSQYPEIKNVTVSLPLIGMQPKVYIEPYRPAFILTTNDHGAFLLDETGRALASTSQITDIDGLQLFTVQDRTGLKLELGKRALPSNTVSFISTVAGALKAANVTPSQLVLPPASSELDVSVAGKPYFVKFNLQNDALQQAGTFLAAKKRVERDHTEPAQYIDVRVPERAYFK